MKIFNIIKLPTYSVDYSNGGGNRYPYTNSYGDDYGYGYGYGCGDGEYPKALL